MRLSPSFRYDQAAVLSDVIVSRARARGARTLLDIGAGDGSVAIPLSRSVQRYVAVEEEPSRAVALQDAGLDTIVATFPIDLDERFDMVVSSHSIPEGGVSLYPPFLSAAWDRVAPGGLLLIVTFKGSDDSAIPRLAQELLGCTHATDHRYTAMLRMLETYGNVTVEKRNSHVETADFADVAAFFGSWFWKTSEQQRDIEPKLRAAMDARFRHDGTYRIPTQHLVIAAEKPG